MKEVCRVYSVLCVYLLVYVHGLGVHSLEYFSAYSLLHLSSVLIFAGSTYMDTYPQTTYVYYFSSQFHFRRFYSANIYFARLSCSMYCLAVAPTSSANIKCKTNWIGTIKRRAIYAIKATLPNGMWPLMLGTYKKKWKK